MNKQSSEEKLFVKKMVSKITFFGIGAHLIYKFYRISGLAKRICQLTGSNNCNEIIKIDLKNEEGQCQVMPEIEEDVILVLKTKDCMLLKFKEVGNYVINQEIESVMVKSDNKILIDSEEFTEDKEINRLVKNISIK